MFFSSLSLSSFYVSCFISSNYALSTNYDQFLLLYILCLMWREPSFSLTLPFSCYPQCWQKEMCVKFLYLVLHTMLPLYVSLTAIIRTKKKKLCTIFFLFVCFLWRVNCICILLFCMRWGTKRSILFCHCYSRILSPFTLSSVACARAITLPLFAACFARSRCCCCFWVVRLSVNIRSMYLII